MTAGSVDLVLLSSHFPGSMEQLGGLGGYRLTRTDTKSRLAGDGEAPAEPLQQLAVCRGHFPLHSRLNARSTWARENKNRSKTKDRQHLFGGFVS